MASMYERDDVDKLMDELTRPFFVLRMARAKLDYDYSKIALDSPYVLRMRKSAQASMEKAKREIREIVRNYV